ncbi:MAG: 50S ribosomal protein L13 [Candidatus Doudnabacteria bacterium]|nr:50S ribosomal protein L13 [Candidatus Doudnabacteria bacterium]
MKTQKITIPKAKDIKRQWFEIDASKATLGRIATQIATILRGKHKRDFMPHMDFGDYIVAINVDKLKTTGRKLLQKEYFRHSGYLGGIKSTKMGVMMQKDSGKVLHLAVKRMLDEIRFRNKLMSRLKLVKGTEHKFKIDKKV